MKNMFRQFSMVSAGLLATLLGAPGLFAQGSLTPPGPPAPTMKTLQQIEPRTPIGSIPFTISSGGSYYLTSNLTNYTGITIAADNVTLDLKGFSIIASGQLLLQGISVSGVRTNISIRNGTVTGFDVDASTAHASQFEMLRVVKGGFGLRTGDGCVVKGCTFKSNQGVGLATGRAALIHDCVAANNGSNGIRAGAGSTVSGCTIVENGTLIGELPSDTGLEAGAGSTVTSCTASGNTGTGITAGDNSTIKSCTSSSNTFFGIYGSSSTLVSECNASRNSYDGISVYDLSTVKGCSAMNNGGDGISMHQQCRVTDNTAVRNAGAGVKANGNSNHIEANVVQQNSKGISCNPSVWSLIIRNSATANGLEYDLAGGNNWGPIVINPGTAFTTTSPWANFDF